MRSIKGFVEQVRKDRPLEFDAYNILEKNNQELQKRINALEKKNLKYYVRAWRSSNQSINNNTATYIDFNATLYPQYGDMHDNVNDDDKVFIRRNGVRS